MSKKSLVPPNIYPSATAPTIPSPQTGDLFFDTSVSQLKIYDGTAWIVAGGGGGSSSVTVSSTAPVGPSEGDMWFDSDTGQMFVYYSSYWLEIGAGSGNNLAITEIDGGAFDSIAPYNGGEPSTTVFALNINGGTP